MSDLLDGATYTMRGDAVVIHWHVQRNQEILNEASLLAAIENAMLNAASYNSKRWTQRAQILKSALAYLHKALTKRGPARDSDYAPEPWMLLPPTHACTIWPTTTIGGWRIMADIAPETFGLAQIASSMTEENARLAVQAPRMLRLLRQLCEEHEAMLDWIMATDPWDDSDVEDSRAIRAEAKALIEEIENPQESDDVTHT